MANRQDTNKIYGSPLYTFKPSITTGGVYINDFKEQLADLPFNFCSIVNNSSTTSIKIYLDNQEFFLLPNEKTTINDRFFRNLKVDGNTADINENDLIIVCQRQGMTADEKSRLDYLKDKNPFNKIINAIPILGIFRR
jgi:hypothetical protein